MASTDATPIPVINTAFRVTFPILDNTGALVSGAASLAAKVSKDAGTFASSSNTPTEIATSSGMYYLDLTSTEMNAQTVAVVVTTTTTNANSTPMVIYPYVSGATALLDANVKKFGGTTVTGRDIGASVLLSSGTGTGQLTFSAGIVQSNVMQIGSTNVALVGSPLTIQFHAGVAGADASGNVTLADSSLTTAKLGTILMPSNVTQILGTASAGAAGYVGIDWGHVNAPTTLVNLSNTTVNTATSVGTVTNLTNAPTVGDFTATMKTSLNSSVPAAISGNVGGISGVTFPTNFGALEITSGGEISEVVLVDTTTNLTNAPTFNGPSASTIAAATRDVNNLTPAANSLGAAVNAASAPTVEEIDDELSANHGSGAWGSSSGSGAFTVTVTVSDGTSPVPNANVRVSSGITSYVATTNGSGVASFALDAATWGLAITKSGYSFTPTAIVVSASANFNETITPVVIPNPPSGSPYCNVFGYFEGLSTSTARGVPITFTLSHTPAKSGAIIITDPIVATIVNGQILGPRGAPFIALVRNDSITPADTTYSVTCQAIGFSNVEMTLSADTFDLSSLIS